MIVLSRPCGENMSIEIHYFNENNNEIRLTRLPVIDVSYFAFISRPINFYLDYSNITGINQLKFLTTNFLLIMR